MKNDRGLGLAGLILAVAYGWQAQQLQVASAGSGAIGPGAFPTLLAIGLAISSLYFMIRPDVDQPWPALKVFVQILSVFVALVVFVITLESVGFIVAAGAVIAFLAWRMGASLKPAALVGGGAAVGMFVLFNYGLELSLPAGALWGMS
ncbi:tripartite tricarboxylate transporter TctB family protein [Stutzerimonas nitrititolerans]|uniref:tripartite tricarboxylate transporter TctB family protein n=1 Tax=Stutzerimonas nitrititolerans TaxID=2482751 RepID=UPI00289A1D5E|nr:tripartite tricarboxylate transporter TctB family protein [Stutzerimonas nitrititolerans]